MNLISRTKVCTIIALIGVAVFMLFACCGRAEAYYHQTLFDLDEIPEDKIGPYSVDDRQGPPDEVPPCDGNNGRGNGNNGEIEDKAYILRYPIFHGSNPPRDNYRTGAQFKWRNDITINITDGVIAAVRRYSQNADFVPYVDEFVNKINDLNEGGHKFVKIYSLDHSMAWFGSPPEEPARVFKNDVCKVFFNSEVGAWKLKTKRPHPFKRGQRVRIGYFRGGREEYGRSIATSALLRGNRHERLTGTNPGTNSNYMYIFEVCDDTSFVVSGYRYKTGPSKNLCDCGGIGEYEEGTLTRDDFVLTFSNSKRNMREYFYSGTYGLELAFLDSSGKFHTVNDFEQLGKTGIRGVFEPSAGLPVKSETAKFVEGIGIDVQDIILRNIPPGLVAVKDLEGKWTWVDIPRACNPNYGVEDGDGVADNYGIEEGQLWQNSTKK